MIRLAQEGALVAFLGSASSHSSCSIHSVSCLSRVAHFVPAKSSQTWESKRWCFLLPGWGVSSRYSQSSGQDSRATWSRESCQLLARNNARMSASVFRNMSCCSGHGSLRSRLSLVEPTHVAPITYCGHLKTCGTCSALSKRCRSVMRGFLRTHNAIPPSRSLRPLGWPRNGCSGASALLRRNYRFS